MQVLAQCVPANTTVNSQISAALLGTEGHQCPAAIRGRYNGRDPDAAVHISPLMTLSWFFKLEIVMRTKRLDMELVWDRASEARSALVPYLLREKLAS